ncbi:MAG: low temperature requirement protein A [Rheinheimera sp.]|nr:low temperature requirement protein A [Rheinheimera sp.]
MIVLGFDAGCASCMVLLWLRASKRHPELKATTRTYAVGLSLVQCYWVALLFVQPLTLTPLLLLFGLGAAFELAVPALAERKGVTPWHRHHMMERYGLLNLIVLGETLLAGSMAIGHLQQFGPIHCWSMVAASISFGTINELGAAF